MNEEINVSKNLHVLYKKKIKKTFTEKTNTLYFSRSKHLHITKRNHKTKENLL